MYCVFLESPSRISAGHSYVFLVEGLGLSFWNKEVSFRVCFLAWSAYSGRALNVYVFCDNEEGTCGSSSCKDSNGKSNMNFFVSFHQPWVKRNVSDGESHMSGFSALLIKLGWLLTILRELWKRSTFINVHPLMGSRYS